MTIKYNEIQCVTCGKTLNVNDGDAILMITEDIDILPVKCPFCEEINDVSITDCNITLDVEIGG